LYATLAGQIYLAVVVARLVAQIGLLHGSAVVSWSRWFQAFDVWAEANGSARISSTS
jgi:hypothetical protein